VDPHQESRGAEIDASISILWAKPSSNACMHWIKQAILLSAAVYHNKVLQIKQTNDLPIFTGWWPFCLYVYCWELKFGIAMIESQ
jgi:hypothetical protein